MVKRGRNDGRLIEQPARRSGSMSGPDRTGLVTLGGMVLLLLVSFMNWRGIEGIEGNLETRFDQIDSRIAKISEKVDKVSTQAAPRRGPDPNKVYKVKTANSPSKGPASAPITVAEFSDFQ